MLPVCDKLLNTQHSSFIFFLSGMVDQLRFVASHLQLPVYGLQSTVDVPQNSIEEVATFYVQVKLLISKHCILQ